jgi:phosphatidylserine/phosphatidylglycerophosphate/cardiolipin synthase-like enzyme
VSITIPVTVTVTIGVPQTTGAPPAATPAGTPAVSVTTPPAAPVDSGAPAAPSGTQPTTAAQPPVVEVSRVEDVLPDFWDHRAEGVLAARVGYFDSGDAVGDVPCIAASVKPSLLSTFELGGPALYKGVPVRYLPADVDEQVQALPTFESVDSISYDDDARTGERFSFAQVVEPMEVIMHVGPEYSWDVLQKFLNDSQGRLVSAMYEFHAPHIKDAIENRLRNGGSLDLVLDNATFSDVSNADAFDRVATFEDWADRFTFTRIVAPEGLNGLISDSYHIKVTVRDDDTFWLSSGNWKAGSSQPIITQEQRDDAPNEDLPGNREWHVVIKNRKLATRFRSHILQDLQRSEDLGGAPVPKRLQDETFVDIPIEEAVVLEARRPPARVIEPRTIPFSTSRKVNVRPLLTPDREGAVYSEAVLGLIQSARTSLLFQIPYIAMPSNPRQDRGFIDELIRALTQKLKSLDDARVILRSGGKNFSAPAHAAWFFKSKGVDIDNRLRVMDDHHTKGMVVDGQRLLLGSHNWSKPGVTLNRDASLLFDDEEVATYYAGAFEIDWARANHVRPKKFVKPEGVVLEAVGDAPPPGFRRVRLSDLVQDD